MVENLDLKLRLLRAEVERKRDRRVDYFRPYAKQWELIALSTRCRETALIAANQVGKSDTGAYASACHMTGEYPAGWPGRKFDHPIRAWFCGVSAQKVRDVQQKKLCGQPGVSSALGTGFIPKASFADKPSMSRGVTDAYDSIQIKHASGGISTATFLSYEQGREKFQGEPVDFLWLDEEPSMVVYGECLTRITATRGLIMATFTPLEGMSDVVLRYLNEPSPDRGYVNMTIDDAEHIPPEERARIIAGYPPHEREARARGVPVLGSGRIFPISEESIREEAVPFEQIPPHWFKIWGIDFGTDHPFAAALLAWDKDTDTLHVLATIRLKDQFPEQHARAMKTIGRSVPVAYPHDGNVRDRGSGDTVAKLYRGFGLEMLPEHATHPDGSISTEAGIMEMAERMTTGRLKVAAHLADWFEEFRLYHRKDGVIVKERDDLMSATRIGVMMKRYARQVALGDRKPMRRRGEIADGVDFDVFA